MIYKRFIYLFIIFFVSTNIFSNIEKYFKKIDKKDEYHCMKNIDFIYLINLDERPEKFHKCEEQLSLYDIYPFRFSAINGWELPLKIINDIGVKFQKNMRKKLWGTSFLIKDNGTPHHEIMHNVDQTYFYHGMTRGAIGCILSHLSILQDAYDSNYQRVWVMEDDVEIKRNPHLISDMIEKLNNLVGEDKWDILFTDRDTKDKQGKYVICIGYALRPNFSPPNPKIFKIRRNISKDFRKIGARYGSYSYVINKSGMKKILDFFKEYKIFLPYDMDYYLPLRINLYTVRDDIVSTQVDAFSDNGNSDYLNK